MRLVPCHATILEIDAPETSASFLTAINDVQIAVMINASVVVVRHERAVGPHLLSTVLAQLEQQGAGVIAGGEENLNADHQRRGGIDRRIHAGAKTLLILNHARFGIQND